MAGNNRRRKVRGESAALDTLHIAVGILVVILAVISFLNPEENMIFFPVIFFLAAVLNLVTGNYRMARRKRENKPKLSAALQMVFGIFLAALAVVSAVSIWWR